MDRSSRHDDDLYAWSQEQADLLRDLARQGSGPSGLDLDNLADEVEDLGRSELDKAESHLRLFLLHLLKIASAPDARPVEHWRAEAKVFHAGFHRAVTRSILRKIDLDQVWQLAVGQAGARLGLAGDAIVAVPDHCPFALDALLAAPPDLDAMAASLRDRQPN